MIAFDTGAFRSFTVAIKLPRSHRFTNMYTPIVDDLNAIYFVTDRLVKCGDAISQKVISQVPQVQWLVRIRRRILDHDLLSVGSQFAEMRIAKYLREG